MPEPESPDDRVWMTHPELPGASQEASRRQFDLVWKQRGWKLRDAPGDAPDGPKPDASTGRARTRKTPTDTAPTDTAAEPPKEN